MSEFNNFLLNSTHIADMAISNVTDSSGRFSYYGTLVPSLGYNAAMIAIWGVLLIIHGFQLLAYRQYWFSYSFIAAIIIEIVGYGGRVGSHYDVYSLGPYIVQSIALVIAPVATMAGLYYQLAKLIEIYGLRFCRLPSPTYYSKIFITFDVASFFIQSAGGGLAGALASSGSDSDAGTTLFIIGLAIQIATMTAFALLWADFMYRIYVKSRKEYMNTENRNIGFWQISQTMIDYQFRPKYSKIRVSPERFSFKYFPLAFMLSVICVFVRCIYRLVEFSSGFLGNISVHEWYFIALDGIMMLIATVSLTIFHPGLAFQGKSYDIRITKGKVESESVNNEDEELMDHVTEEYDYEMTPGKAT
ncbi:hypothetical protein Kpol_1017p11 [Vanderwaltozyma polyspora DSM 70294]|uniref:Sphingoid long-chain base transporter RSB1 n=1 Tax=Vanderwaltozyma polyspora (strain ATCC 22028 / DSM 70294 / BCRC 21397 / CBS 2163 / NBRC 10782 / NRRL Y-8283 / UCD 57-17) TaxID=436907 RepID=A7TRD8_VANPO|nr:uncharacterized protein Kpol_1017p11 [Vanderwaltozyma polyspora DSM 70294]EDO15177.1 hypothetical protein Kpol_1017p11 [Vanderwaltozyma polyspora DSM 70294]